MKSIIIGIVCVFLLSACSARQVSPTYEGLTAQKLLSQSVDKGMESISQLDLMQLRNKKVYLDWNALSTMSESDYIKARFIMELEVNKIQVVSARSSADYSITVFCTGAGTDSSFSGFETPDMSVSALPIPRVKLFGIDLYKGEVQFYYYLKDSNGNVVKKSELVDGRADSNRLNLFTIGIPIKNVK